MRFSRRFAVFTLLIAATIIWKFNSWNDSYAAVETFRGAQIDEGVLYPIMSKNLNETNQLKIYVNGEMQNNSQHYAILDDMLNPVGSLDFVRAILKTSAFMEDESTAVIQIVDSMFKFTAGDTVGLNNGEEMALHLAPEIRNGQMYLGIEDLCQVFGYAYSYDKSNHTVQIEYENEPALPASYDLRSFNRASSIRNQGSTSTCWAYASVEALESALLPVYQYNFSVDSMIKDNSFKLDPSAGGEYTMALAYLLSWQGPTQDEQVETTATKPVHLQDVQFYGKDDKDAIKKAVYRYGGVSTSIYASVSSADLDGEVSYNPFTYSYCYKGDAKPNHDVVIIGWDDNYPAGNFMGNAQSDGAFICQNSWGSAFGEKGVFYVSYEDSNIGNQAVSYAGADTNSTYAYINQSDLCGWTAKKGYGKQWAYAANVFTASSDRQVEAAGFYALGKDTTYQIYFVPKFKDTSDLAVSKKKLVASGVVENAGYYTIRFNSPKVVKKGDEFAIVVYVNTPNEDRPIALEKASDELSQAVNIKDGRGYTSTQGVSSWDSVEEIDQANLCIKAYSNNVVEVFNEKEKKSD